MTDIILHHYETASFWDSASPGYQVRVSDQQAIDLVGRFSCAKLAS